jgi:hypothetical protein
VEADGSCLFDERLGAKAAKDAKKTGKATGVQADKIEADQIGSNRDRFYKRQTMNKLKIKG